MIRRILEAIDEVELRPTDPFKKKPGGKLGVLEALRQAIFDELGAYVAAYVGAYGDGMIDEWDHKLVKAIIAKATYEGDPHQWCGGDNVAVVYHESGIPGPNEEEFAVDYASIWMKIDERASALCGRKLLSEPYNAAVTCVYEEK